MAVALYARVSTGKQAEKELSIPDQLKQMRAWCKANNYAVVIEYIEAGASATDDKRPEFQRMISDALTKPAPFEAIIVHSLSRFFRDSIDFGVYERQLNKNGVKLISITQQTGDDNSGHMARKIFSVFDEYQSKENSKHTSRALNENAIQGYFNGSHPPFGYHAIEISKATGSAKKKKLVIEPTEAEIVRVIFELFTDGHNSQNMGVKKIAAHFNAQGALRRGKLWSKQRIYEILKNENYIGIYYFNKKHGKTGKIRPVTEWIKVDIDPLISEEIFAMAAKKWLLAVSCG